MPTSKLQEPRITTAVNADIDVQPDAAKDRMAINIAVSGVGRPNAALRFTIDGKANAGTARADASGVWNFTPTGLLDGQHTIVVSETDAAGDHVTASLSFSFGVTDPAAVHALSFEEPEQQASGDALDNADKIIKMFLDEIKRSNKLMRPDNLELRREYRQQYGRKIVLEMMLFKGAEQILDKYSVHPLEQNWIMCRGRGGKPIESLVTEQELSRMSRAKVSADVTKHDVREIVAMLVAQCDPAVIRKDPHVRTSGKAL